MTEEQYLLTCLSEECAEVAQLASKAARFGLDPDPRRPAEWRDVDNRKALAQELGDLIAVASMLGLKPPGREAALAKEAKVRRFMALSRRLGALRR